MRIEMEYNLSVSGTPCHALEHSHKQACRSRGLLAGPRWPPREGAAWPQLLPASGSGHEVAPGMSMSGLARARVLRQGIASRLNSQALLLPGLRLNQATMGKLSLF